MSDPDELLRRVCGALGISVGYHQICGRYVDTPRETLWALVAALGVRVDHPEALGGALVRIEVERWEQCVEPVVLMESDRDDQQVRVSVPKSHAGGHVSWRLTEESGAVVSGECALSSLPMSGENWIDGRGFEARMLAPGRRLPAGYHRIEVRIDGRAPREALVVSAPQRCWRPPEVETGGRAWGLSVQLHSLRSSRNWGIGDFGDLYALLGFAAQQGADLVGLNPLHALFGCDPERASPYSPSSRCWLNPLYIEIDAVPDVLEDAALRARIDHPDFQARLERLRSVELIDHRGVAAAKHDLLRAAWGSFMRRHLGHGTDRERAFRAFQASAGAGLRRFAQFEAIQGELHRRDPGVWGWPVWPEPLRDPGSDAVARFAQERLDEIEYHEYLQWIARLQFERVAHRCVELGMAIGLYADLAVSVDPGGSDTWGGQVHYALEFGVGAPPDDFNRTGQSWGLPPLHPVRLREAGYAPFVEALRANMRGAGAIRIDHVMSLMRLFWIPRGGQAAAGGYVGYRLDEMAAIVALESHRNGCAVIGEDLGTVPDEVRSMMWQRGLLAYRLLYFERYPNGDFRWHADFPRDALVSVGTHDLPPLAEWWTGKDVDVRDALGLLPPEHPAQRLRDERRLDRERLVRALGRDPDGANAPIGPDLAAAVHGYLASTPSVVMTVQMEDLLLLTDQANLPGTVDEHPNWRRKLPLPLDRLGDDPGLMQVVEAVASRRGLRRCAGRSGGV